jgi:hypothetical protein
MLGHFKWYQTRGHRLSKALQPWCTKDGSSCVQPCGGQTMFYWKRKMKIYLGSINDQVWEETENDFMILDPDNLTNNDKANKQCNTMAPNTIYNAIDSKVFEQIKDLDRASEV